MKEENQREICKLVVMTGYGGKTYLNRNLVPFNRLQLTNLYFSGFRYLVVEVKNESYGLVQPLVKAKRVSGKKYILPIMDHQVLEMAGGIDYYPIFLKNY